MLSKEQIINSSEIYEKPPIAGVYFLIRKSEIVYIGSSEDIITRLKTHRNVCRFDSFSFVEVYDNLKMLELETEYIKKFKPIHNIKDNPLAIEEMQKAISLIKEHNLPISVNQYVIAKEKEYLGREKVEKIFFTFGIESKIKRINALK